MIEKSIDDMKLEVLVARETSMMEAQRLAREYFPFQACNLVNAIKVVIAIYEEFYEEESPDRKKFSVCQE
jgi:hypothetical protein